MLVDECTQACEPAVLVPLGRQAEQARRQTPDGTLARVKACFPCLVQCLFCFIVVFRWLLKHRSLIAMVATYLPGSDRRWSPGWLFSAPPSQCWWVPDYRWLSPERFPQSVCVRAPQTCIFCPATSRWNGGQECGLGLKHTGKMWLYQLAQTSRNQTSIASQRNPHRWLCRPMNAGIGFLFRDCH